MDVVTAWVKPPKTSGGLDHLGAQAPCISLYARLVPGITNVTDRARYYTLYPWFIWAFDRESASKDKAEFQRLFRRADCLLTLAAERHARVSLEADPQDDRPRHSGGMVGINALTHAVDELEAGKSLDLSPYAATESSDKRYFKNPFGGLGQYYRGVFLELGLLVINDEGSLANSEELGVPLAEAIDSGVDRARFFDVLRQEVVSVADLDDLSSFCACQLAGLGQEQQKLQALFFNNASEPAVARRASLALILHLASSLEAATLPDDLERELLLGCFYGRRLPNGSNWQLPDHLEQARRNWTIYVRNEMLQVAIHGLFSAALQCFHESDLGTAFPNSSEFASWLTGQSPFEECLSAMGSDPVHALVEKAGPGLPDIGDWTNKDHEYQLANGIPITWRGSLGAERLRDVVERAMRVLIALAARERPSDAYQGLILLDERGDHVINLEEFERHQGATWLDMSPPRLFEWLVVHWGIETHLSVALRKLRHERLDTFRIRPTDRGLVLSKDGVPFPVHTNPRLRQSVQILRDLGALARSRGEPLRLTDLGRTLLGECLAA